MNLIQITTLFLFIVSLLLGLLVYLKDRTVSLNKRWFVFTFFVASWAISLYFVTSSSNKEIAHSWQYFLDLFALGIPISYFYFVRAFLGVKKKFLGEKIVIISTILVALFSFSPLFKIGVEKRFDFYWVEPGSLYIIFPITFLSIILYALWLLASAYLKNKNNVPIQNQIKYQIIACIVGFVGCATNFLPQLFNIFPFGSYVVLIYLSCVSYLILKYKLFNVKLIFVEIAVISINILLALNVISSQSRSIFALNTAVSVAVFAFSGFLIRGIYKDIRDRERIQKLADEMADANKRLFALEQQKTEFVSIASHQLRTPMTVIKGYASMVLEGAFGVLSEKAKEAMVKLYEASDKIVTLIEDLLTVSRIEQGRGMPVFETINFVTYVRGLMAPFITHAREAGLTMSFNASEGSLGARVPLDKKKFEQAMKHLIDNAITYTKSPGSVVVTVSLDNTQHKVYVSISDTGIGMTDVQIKKLLGKNNIEANSREGSLGFSVKERQKELLLPEESEIKKKSSGIGFYIAQEIINAHYGNIQIQSDGPNKGTTVIVELPELG